MASFFVFACPSTWPNPEITASKTELSRRSQPNNPLVMLSNLPCSRPFGYNRMECVLTTKALLPQFCGRDNVTGRSLRHSLPIRPGSSVGVNWETMFFAREHGSKSFRTLDCGPDGLGTRVLVCCVGEQISSPRSLLASSAFGSCDVEKG